MKRFIGILFSLLMIFALFVHLRGTFSVPEIRSEPILAPTPEPTFKPTPELMLPYAEKFSLSFADKHDLAPIFDQTGAIIRYKYQFSAPYYISLKNYDTGELIPNSEDESIVANNYLTYWIEDISILPSGKNGKVVLSFDFFIQNNLSGKGAEYILDKTAIPKGHGVAFRFSGPSFFDYYTGMTIPCRSMFGNNSSSILISLEIDGRPVEIESETSIRHNSFWGGASDIGGGIWQNYYSIYSVISHRFTIPDDYDGLCFYMLKNQYGEDYKYVDLDYKFSESKPLLEAMKDNSPENHYLVRLSDLKVALDERKGEGLQADKQTQASAPFVEAILKLFRHYLF